MSPKEKKVKADSKDPKNAPKKASSSTTQAIPVDGRPNNLSFLYSIDIIKPSYVEQERKYLNVGRSGGSNISKLWYPPTRRNQFQRTQKGSLYRWRMGISTLLKDAERPHGKFEVASVFFQARQDNFVVTSLDCMRDDVGKEPAGWGYLSFHHLRGNLSAVDFVAPEFRLAAPARGSTWMPQVLPEVYDYETRGPHARKFRGPSGGLCGKLSLLIGMAAFSAEERDAEATVQQCFRFGNWGRHQFETGIGRYEDRGVIVSIYLDSAAEGITEAHLRAFEDGKYGPIWEGLPAEESAYTMTPNRGMNRLDLQQTIPRTVPSVGNVSFSPAYSVPPTVPGGYTPGQSTYSPRTETTYREEDDDDDDDGDGEDLYGAN